MKKIMFLLTICNMLNCESNVHIYGLARSGTNFLEMLLVDNFDLHIDCRPGSKENKEFKKDPGYKHFRIFDDKNLITNEEVKNDIIVKNLEDLDILLGDIEHKNKYIVIYKNIYSWLSSYKNFCGKIKHYPSLFSCAKEYIAFRNKWNKLKNERVLFINYNDFILQPINKENPIMKEIITFLQKPLKRESILHRLNVPSSLFFSGRRRDFYRKKMYLKLFSAEMKQMLSAMLDESDLPHEE